MEFEVPKRHILRLALSVDMVHWVCGGRGKKGGMVEKKARPHGIEILL
jgi:hypothetical protein